jgi:hypothetical protein
VSPLKPLALATIVLLSAITLVDARSAPPSQPRSAQAPPNPLHQVREANTVQTFPDIEQENGRDTICGIRMLFSASDSSVDFDLYDLTIAMYVSESRKGLTVIRATKRNGNLTTDPNLLKAVRIQPTDLVFGVAPFKNPVGLRDLRTTEGILVGTVDESKAPKAGDYGGALFRHLLHGEPVLVIWSDGSGAPQSISVKTPDNPIVFEALQTCLRGTLPIDG